MAARVGAMKSSALTTRSRDAAVLSRTVQPQRLVVSTGSKTTKVNGRVVVRGRRGDARDNGVVHVSVTGSRRGEVVARAAADKTFDTSKIRIGEEGLIIETSAESLLQAATESGDAILKKVASDMDSLQAAVSSEDFVTYLNDPTVEIIDKVTTIKEAAKTLGWHEFTVNVAEILLERNRSEVIVDLPDAFKTLYNALQKTMVRREHAVDEPFLC